MDFHAGCLFTLGILVYGMIARIRGRRQHIGISLHDKVKADQSVGASRRVQVDILAKHVHLNYPPSIMGSYSPESTTLFVLHCVIDNADRNTVCTP